MSGSYTSKHQFKLLWMNHVTCILETTKKNNAQRIASYVGETERPLAKWLKEHRRPKSPVCEHMTEVSHRFIVNQEDVAVRCHERDWFRRGVAEAICIATDRPPLNQDRGRHTLPAIYRQLLSRDTMTSLTTGSHVTTRKLQFAEEGPTLRVESYDLLKTLCWCEHAINSIIKEFFQTGVTACCPGGSPGQEVDCPCPALLHLKYWNSGWYPAGFQLDYPALHFTWVQMRYTS